MHEAIIQAGRRRLRAVLLTATTTVVGLLPTAYGWGGMDPFVAPMALALSWGLMFATGVTLITIPATLAAAHDVKYALKKLLFRKEAVQESVSETGHATPRSDSDAVTEASPAKKANTESETKTFQNKEPA